jgi:tetratricopeptide (TPR) repeat protein
MRRQEVLRAAERFLVRREYGKAVREYQKLLRLDPNDPRLLSTIGDTLLKQDQKDEALENFRRVVDVYLERGFSLKAIAMLGKILRIDSSDLHSRQILADLFEKQGLFHEASRQLKLLVEQSAKRGDRDEQLLYLEHLCQLQPDNAEFWSQRARISVQCGRPEEALESLLKALVIQAGQERWEEVFDLSGEALAIDSSQRKFLQGYVRAAEKLNRMEVAEQFLRAEIERSGKELPFQLFIARIAELRGDPEAAGQIYSSLREKGYQDPWIDQGPGQPGLSEEVLDLFAPEAQPQEAVQGGVQADLEQQAGWSSDPQGELVFSCQPDSGQQTPGAGADPLSVPVDKPGAPGSSTEIPEQGRGSLEESLEEADFYLKLGFRNDAKQLLESLMRQYPSEERVLRRAAKVMTIQPDLMSGTLEEEVQEFAEGLEAEIEEAIGSLFSEGPEESKADEVLRYDVPSRTAQKGKSTELHYSLGVAYKEMGLFEDAVKEFLSAVSLAEKGRHLPQRILCCSMLASSYNEMGLFDEAIHWSEKGLKIPGMREFEWKALKFDLATGLEKKEQSVRARKIYQEVLARDPEYRDVRDRLESMESAGDR